jgi:hypothetical protein
MVRPCMQPSNISSRMGRVSLGSIQLLVGPESSCDPSHQLVGLPTHEIHDRVAPFRWQPTAPKQAPHPLVRDQCLSIKAIGYVGPQPREGKSVRIRNRKPHKSPPSFTSNTRAVICCEVSGVSIANQCLATLIIGRYSAVSVVASPTIWRGLIRRKINASILS